MGRFKQREEFEREFERMGLEDLRRWRRYWIQHAQLLGPKVRKQAMKRVHKIEKAISLKESEQ